MSKFHAERSRRYDHDIVSEYAVYDDRLPYPDASFEAAGSTSSCWSIAIRTLSYPWRHRAGDLIFVVAVKP